MNSTIRKLKFLFTFIVLLFTYQLWAEEISITLKTATLNIKGTLLLPDQKQSVPLVILISGSGPTDRDGNQANMKNNSLKLIAEGLKINGIATLRYDKRAIGESRIPGLDEKTLLFENYINDVKDWVNLLYSDERFSKIVIAGHSEGSLIGMSAAVGNKKVKGFISIAGSGRPADELLKEQLALQPLPVKEMAYKMIDQLKKGETIQDVPSSMNSLFRKSVQPYMISWFKYNPQTEIAKLTIPVLIVQGTTDIQVKVTDYDLLSKAKPNAKKQLIFDMNHVLKSIATIDRTAQLSSYTNPDLPLHPGLTDILVNFIKTLN